MDWRGKNEATLNPWFQVLLWWLVVLDSIMILVMVFTALQELILSKPPPRDDYLIFLAGFALLLGVLIRFWWRYWFLVSDLHRLLQAREGTEFQVRRRWLRPKVKARVRDLWVFARFDHPIWDYSPSRQTDLGLSGLLKSPRKWKWNRVPSTWEYSGGFRPGYMLSLSRVNLFCLGDFSKLPPAERHVTKAWSSDSVSSQTNEQTLDNALRAAAGVLRDPDLTLTVEVREKWLRVEVKGGTWLGAVFGQRIQQTLDFSERLIQELAPCFTPLGPNEWTIDSEGEAFVVKPIDKDRPTSGSDDGPSHKVGTLSTLLIIISHINWMTYFLPSIYSGSG